MTRRVLLAFAGLLPNINKQYASPHHLSKLYYPSLCRRRFANYLPSSWVVSIYSADVSVEIQDVLLVHNILCADSLKSKIELRLVTGTAVAQPRALRLKYLNRYSGEAHFLHLAFSGKKTTGWYRSLFFYKIYSFLLVSNFLSSFMLLRQLPRPHRNHHSSK